MRNRITPLARRYSRAYPLLIALLVTSYAPGALANETDANHAQFATFLDPPATPYRSADGKPGPAHWTQHTDYRIRVKLDPATNTLQGEAEIAYTNRSPDALRYLWLHVDQNFFRSGSRSAYVHSPGSEFHGAFEHGGLDVTEIRISDVDGRYEPQVELTDTRMRVDLRNALVGNGGNVTLEVKWNFVVPEENVDRMGRIPTENGWKYAVAQWYPRIAVYDDLRGWNTRPYLGQGNFYMGYADFRVEVTVPRAMIVAATGELQNPEDVLTQTQRRRLQEARSAGEPVRVIHPEEAGSPAARPAGSGPLTWIYVAENVRDFAWGASESFMWDAAAWRSTLVMSFYLPEELGGEGQEPGWEIATEVALHGLEFFSEWLYEYPYPVLINLSGTDDGMEYPMIHFIGGMYAGEALIGYIQHELAHAWFPMIVGSDERAHAWMDEGFATYMADRAHQDYGLSAAQRPLRVKQLIEELRLPHHCQPVLTLTDALLPEEAFAADSMPSGAGYSSLSLLAYDKPAYALLMLRELILGPDRFDAAIRTYIDRWAYRHPRPADFFRTLESVSGEQLDWFWRGWYDSTGTLDQAVQAVSHGSDGPRLYLLNLGDLVMPVVVRIAYENGHEAVRRLPVEIWLHDDRYRLKVAQEKRVRSVTIDPERQLPDINRSNNVWLRNRN